MRSALLVVVYAAGFFPLSALPGPAAQYISIVPVAVIASWLGMRGGLLVALGFVPLLAALSVFAQGHAWDYMLHEARPSALMSLVAMAAVAGRASELGRRLHAEQDVSEAYLDRLETLAGDRARLISLGIELAGAHTTNDVYRVADSTLRRWFPADQTAFGEIDEQSGATLTRFSSETTAAEPVTLSKAVPAVPETGPRDGNHGHSKPNSEVLDSEQDDETREGVYRSVLKVPLKTRDTETGYVALSSLAANAFTRSDTEVLVAAAQQITPNLRAAALYDASVRETGMRKALNEVARALSMSAGLEVLCQVAGYQMAQMLHLGFGFIAETGPGEGELSVRHTFGAGVHALEPGGIFEWPSEYTGTDDEVRFWNVDPNTGGGAHPLSEFTDELYTSVATLTLMTEGEPVGWMVLATSGRSLKDEISHQLIQGIGAQVANAIVRERVENEQKRLLDRLAGQNTELRAARARLQESQDEIEKQNHELQRANDAKSTFLSAVSHELKTPLAIMVGFSELLGMNVTGNLSEQQLEQLRMVERNGRHLDLLVSDLVDVSRIESGRLAVNLEPVQPAEVLSETLTGLDSIAVAKQQTIRRDFALEDAWLRADRARLGQVVTNLVTNALKYSPEKSEVTVQAQLEDTHLVVTVADSGIGITHEDQKRLFTPFFRSTNEVAQNEKGTGLGLVITRSIVEMHGGSLDLESELGEGTKITVTMPGVMESGPEESSGASFDDRPHEPEAVDDEDAA